MTHNMINVNRQLINKHIDIVRILPQIIVITDDNLKPIPMFNLSMLLDDKVEWNLLSNYIRI